MRRVHVGPIIVIMHIVFDFQFFPSLKITNHFMINNPRKRKQEARRLGG